MASNEAGVPADSPDAADVKENTSADITEPAGKPLVPDPVTEQKLQGSDESAALVEQGETAPGRWSRRAVDVIPHQSKRRWAALTATVTATAGLVTGWAIRRGRSRKPRWPRRGR